MKTLPDRLTYPTPFAGGEGADLTPFSDSIDGDKVNFKTGFPSAYSAPKENGGKFITRKEMNYLGNIATKNDYYKMCGGINTFDPVFAGKIGGYPKDAILDYFDGINLFKVISLVEDNTHDFRSGSFGGSWAKLGTNDIFSSKPYILDSFTDFTIAANTNSALLIGGPYPIEVSGILSIKVHSYEIVSYSTSSSIGMIGAGFLGKVSNDGSYVLPSLSGSTGSYNGFSLLPGFPSDFPTLIYSGVSNVYPSSNALFCKKGDVFVLAAQNGNQESQSAKGCWSVKMSFDVIIY